MPNRTPLALFATVLLSILLTAEGSFAHEAACTQLFSAKRFNLYSRPEALEYSRAVYGEPGENASRVLKVYDSSFTSVAHTGALSSGHTPGKFIRQWFKFNEADYTFKIEKVAFQGDPSSSSSAPAAVAPSYAQWINRYKEFVLRVENERNIQRRAGEKSWSEQTLEQVASDIEKWADVSRFITVELAALKDHPNTESPIIGSLKVVAGGAGSPKKELPLEVEYGISLPENAGRKFELGNYAVDDPLKWNAKATLELFLQIAVEAHQQTKAPGHLENQPLYYIASDPDMARIYRSFGFTKMKDVVDHEGNPWQVLQASAETVLESVNLQVRQSRRLKLPQSEDRVRGLTDILPLGLEDSAVRIYGFPRIRLDLAKNAERHLYAVISEVLPKLPVGAARSASGYPQQNGSPVRRIKIADSKDPKLTVDVFLPAHHFPLHDGLKVNLWPNTLVSYSKGILRIEQKYSDQTVFQTTEVTIDPEFREPTRFRYRREPNERFERAEVIAEVR